MFRYYSQVDTEQVRCLMYKKYLIFYTGVINHRLRTYFEFVDDGDIYTQMRIIYDQDIKILLREKKLKRILK